MCDIITLPDIHLFSFMRNIYLYIIDESWGMVLILNMLQSNFSCISIVHILHDLSEVLCVYRTMYVFIVLCFISVVLLSENDEIKMINQTICPLQYLLLYTIYFCSDCTCEITSFVQNASLFSCHWAPVSLVMICIYESCFQDIHQIKITNSRNVIRF